MPDVQAIPSLDDIRAQLPNADEWMTALEEPDPAEFGKVNQLLENKTAEELAINKEYAKAKETQNELDQELALLALEESEVESDGKWNKIQKKKLKLREKLAEARLANSETDGLCSRAGLDYQAPRVSRWHRRKVCIYRSIQ